jgi:ubiquinol-cytochrome c reductase cytochrome b subunit
MKAENVLLAIQLQMQLKTLVYVAEKDPDFYRLTVSSVRNIDNVIKFMHCAPVQLMGFKRLQYILWLKKLRTIDPYSTRIHIPDTY